MGRIILRRGSTQAVALWPRVRAYDLMRLAQPTAASCIASSPSGTTSPNVAIDTVATTASSIASEGDTVIALAAPQPILEGARYLVTCVDGQLAVRAAQGGTTASLRCASPLPCDVPAGSTIEAMAVVVSMTDAETSMVGKGSLLVDVTMNGISHQWAEMFEVVTRIQSWALDADELTRRMPEVLALRDRSDVTMSETIDAALEEHLIPRLRAKKIREDRIVSTWALVPAHVAAVRVLLAASDPATTEARAAQLRADLDQALELALSDVDGWYDAPQVASVPAPADPGVSYAGSRYTR